MDFQNFLSHGVTVAQSIRECGGENELVDFLHGYITGAAADEAENNGDKRSAREYRAVTRAEVANWVSKNK